MRPTPFAFVFGDIAPARFPAIAGALEQQGATATDRDRFVLLEPVGRLLRELLPQDAGGRSPSRRHDPTAHRDAADRPELPAQLGLEQPFPIA